jgi:hypothetical protein
LVKVAVDFAVPDESELLPLPTSIPTVISPSNTATLTGGAAKVAKWIPTGAIPNIMILSFLFPAESAAQATLPQNKIDRHSILSFLIIIPLINNE